MALFKKEKGDEEAPMATPSYPDKSSSDISSRKGGQSLVGKGLRIEGEIRGDDELLIEGTVKGKIDTNQTVTIGQTGELHAEVHGQTVIVLGRVNGDIFATQKVLLKPTAKVTGNITSPTFVVNEGAAFEGNIHMEAPGKKIPGATPVDAVKNGSDTARNKNNKH